MKDVLYLLILNSKHIVHTKIYNKCKSNYNQASCFMYLARVDLVVKDFIVEK